MCNAFPMHIAHPHAQLPDNLPDFPLPQEPSPIVLLLDVFVEALAFYVLHYEVEGFAGVDGFVEFYDVGVREAFQELDFSGD